jgi:PAS domain S-box-containing protein
MWINQGLRVLRRHPVMSGLASAVIVAAAVVTKLLLPHLPPLITLFPAVVLCAFVGGKWTGRVSLAVCALAAAYFLQNQPADDTHAWETLSWFAFILFGVMIVVVIERLDAAITNFQIEQRKLDLVLKAAGAATWEMYPNGRLHWDDNFYRLVGLERSGNAPSTDRFLAMVHPEDRPRLQEARDRMHRGEQPATHDEYRLIRPDGQTLWLENHRVRGKPGEYLFIGITQDITQRKQAEEQIRALLHELAHRVKNQFSVITKIASETRNQTGTPEEFDALFQSRMSSMARSHDLLVKGGGNEADLRDLLLSQLESFAVEGRVEAEGPPLKISSNATQYLAMAFHELATNAIKYGAFSNAEGRVRVTWQVKQDVPFTLVLEWRETGGPKPEGYSAHGFGSKVLNRLTPSALSGTAEVIAGSAGIIWRLEAPLEAVSPKA